MKSRTVFVVDKELFEKRKKRVDSFFNGRILPDNIFSLDYKWFSFLEFEDIFTEDFYNYYSFFIKNRGHNYFSLFTLDPDPKEYFFKFFKQFNLIDFFINEDFKSFIKKLNTDPDDSPADALRYNSNVIVLFSEDLNLFIYGNREEEFAIIVSNNEVLFKDFVNNYPKADTLFDVKSYVENLLPLRFSNVPISEKDEAFYRDLIKNYK